MDRIYNKSNSVNHLNQIGLINFPITSSQSAFCKSGAVQTRSINQSVKNKIFNKLTKSIFDILLTSAKSVYFAQSENIYCQDDPIRFVYFPQTAVFSEYKIIEDGRMMEIIMTGKEGLIGISSLFNAHRAENFTQILQAGYALQMDSEFLRGKFNEHAEVKELIFDYFNEFVNQISQRVICRGFHLVENRLCCWLLMLQDRAGGGKLDLTHEQIALSLGAHRPSITQITKKLREEEIIDYKRGAIFILNRGKLENAACSCYVPVN